MIGSPSGIIFWMLWLLDGNIIVNVFGVENNPNLVFLSRKEEEEPLNADVAIHDIIRDSSSP